MPTRPEPTRAQRIQAYEEALTARAARGEPPPNDDTKRIMQAYYLLGARVEWGTPNSPDIRHAKWEGYGGLAWYSDYTYGVYSLDAHLLLSDTLPINAVSASSVPAPAPVLVGLAELNVGDVAVIRRASTDVIGAIVLCVYNAGQYKRLVCIDCGGCVGATRGRTTWSWDTEAEVLANTFRFQKINMTLEGLT